MTNFELAKLYTERVRVAHLTVILTSAIILISLSADLFRHKQLLNELAVIKELSESIGIPSEFLVESVVSSIDSQVEQGEIDKAHQFADSIRDSDNIQISVGSLDDFMYENDLRDLGWFGLVGYFYEPLRNDTGFEDFFYLDSQIVGSAQDFLNLWDDMDSVREFRLITGVEGKKLYYYQRGNGVFFPEEKCKDSPVIEMDYSLESEQSLFKFLKPNKEYLLSVDVFAEQYCDFLYERILNTVAIEIFERIPSSGVVHDGAKKKQRLVESEVIFQILPNSELIHVDMRKLLIEEALNMDDPELREIIGSDFKYTRRFFDTFREIDFHGVTFDGMENVIKRTDSLEDGYVNILGMQSPKSSIISWGGILVFSSLIYFSIHYVKLKRLVSKESGVGSTEPHISLPWIGLYDDVNSKIVMIITSLFLPIMSGGLSLYSLLDSPISDFPDYTKVLLNIIFMVWGAGLVIFSIFCVDPKMVSNNR